MAELYSILFKKSKTGSNTKDSFLEWKIACTSVPFDVYPKIKELPSNDWPDEHGDDTFIPAKLMIAAYDYEINFCYKGLDGSAYSAIKPFIDYLTGVDGNGVELSIYSPYNKIGRQKAYFTGLSDLKYRRMGAEDVLTFSVKFRITDPVTDITL